MTERTLKTITVFDRPLVQGRDTVFFAQQKDHDFDLLRLTGEPVIADSLPWVVRSVAERMPNQTPDRPKCECLAITVDPT